MLLTIAIPTYNRATYLELNLKQLFSQLKKEYAHDLEVIISDNQSTDNTAALVAQYVAANNFANIIYHYNYENIGADPNITQCFAMATGDFVMVFGDDDFLVDGALDKIFQVIRQNQKAGVINVNHYGYHKDYNTNKPRCIIQQYQIYESKEAFINKVTYNFTFITGNIVNKKLATKNLDLYKFINTSLNQLNWTFNALLLAPYNIFIEEHLIAMKTENSGGYGFCEIFGKNFNLIVNYYVNRGLRKSYFRFTNSKLLTIYFPELLKITKVKATDYKHEDYLNVLSSVYKFKPQFWLLCMPYIYMPIILAKPYFLLNKIYHKLEFNYYIKFKEYFLKRSGKIKTIILQDI